MEKQKKVILSNQLINKLRHMRKWPNRSGHGRKQVIRSIKVLSFSKKPWKKKVFLLKLVLQKYPRLLLPTMGLVNQSLEYWPNMMLCLDFLRK